MSNNNEICYSTKIQTFSPTKHKLIRSCCWLHVLSLGAPGSDTPGSNRHCWELAGHARTHQQRGRAGAVASYLVWATHVCRRPAGRCVPRGARVRQIIRNLASSPGLLKRGAETETHRREHPSHGRRRRHRTARPDTADRYDRYAHDAPWHAPGRLVPERGLINVL